MFTHGLDHCVPGITLLPGDASYFFHLLSLLLGRDLAVKKVLVVKIHSIGG